jgi:hypothetical protein
LFGLQTSPEIRQSQLARSVSDIQTTLRILHTYWSCLRQAIQDVR